MFVYQETNIPITPQELWKYEFENEYGDTWEHLASGFSIIKTGNSYSQCRENEEGTIGIPMQFMHELLMRCYSMNGYVLKAWEGDAPRNAQ